MPSVKFADDVTEHIFEKDEREHFKVSSTYGPRPTYEFWSPPIRASRRDDYTAKKLFTSSSDNYIPKSRSSHEILRSHPSSMRLSPSLKSQYQARTSSLSDMSNLRRDYNYALDSADYGPKYGRSWSSIHSKLARVSSPSPVSPRGTGGAYSYLSSSSHSPATYGTSLSSHPSSYPATFRRSPVSNWRPDRAIISRSYSAPSSYTRSSLYDYSPRPSTIVRRLHRSLSTPYASDTLSSYPSYQSPYHSASYVFPSPKYSSTTGAIRASHESPVISTRSSNWCNDHPSLSSTRTPTPHHLFPYRQYSYDPHSADSYSTWYDDWRVRWRTPQMYKRRDKYTPRLTYV